MKNVLTPWLRNATVASLLSAATSFAQATDTSATAPAPTVEQKPEDAPPTKEQCLESHRGSQQAQNEGKLVHARELARTCTNSSCPGLLVSDCARWLSDLDQRVPSAVFEVNLDGNPVRNAYVFIDGKPIPEWTRGEAAKLDPGEHQIRFELNGQEPIVQTLLFPEGMRYRLVKADFKSPVKPVTAAAVTPTTTAPLTTPPQPPKERPTPFIVYPLLGVGVLGAAGFGAFAFLGSKKEKELEDSCSPNCTDADLKPMKRNYLIGDISLGIGAASLIAGGVIYFTRPEKDAAPAVGFVPLPGGAAGFASYRF